MRHRATRPFLDLLHRVPRAFARPVSVLSRLGSLRFAAGLLAAMVVGTGAFVAVASMGDRSEDPVAGPSAPTDRTGSEASRSAERQELADPSARPSQDGADAPTPSSSPTERASRDAEPTSPPRPEDAAQEAAKDAGSSVEKARSTTPSPAPDASAAAPPPADRSAPQTTLSVSYPSGDTARFSFGADEAATFACSLDGGAFSSCTSTATYTDLDPGKHTFRVRATDLAGNVDPTPASVTWHANRGPSVDD